jgi:MFS family permease
MPGSPTLPWGLDRRAWFALLAAWLGWGFDVFDALLFNFVAPNCIPTLLGIPLGTPAARAATAQWTGVLTALLLVGWAIGGVIFGHVADRIGRARALMLTIALYAGGTAACAFATSLPMLVLCRAVASLGIGGEWAAGATLVAETVPPARREAAAALMMTSSPLSLFLASGVTFAIAGHWLPDRPDVSWRYVFACGLAPVLVVLFVRLFVRESPGWAKPTARRGMLEGVGALFARPLRAATLSGLTMALLALLAWWSCNAFLPAIGDGLGRRRALELGLAGRDAVALAEGWKATATMWFNVGGVAGAFLCIAIAPRLTRRNLFATYFALGAAALFATFVPAWPPEVQLRLTFLVGLAVYGIFATFNFYLPELYPPEQRALGAGFTYNFGRMFAAAGPFAVGAWSARQPDPTQGAIDALLWVAAVPVIALVLTRLIVETRPADRSARGT